MRSFGQELQNRARQMRREPTPAEKILWEHLSRSQLGGYKFRRQAVLAPYIADFFCPTKALIVEVDGDTHAPERDERRDFILAERGFSTIRFTNEEVHANVEGVLTALLLRLKELPDRWHGPTAVPTPAHGARLRSVRGTDQRPILKARDAR